MPVAVLDLLTLVAVVVILRARPAVVLTLLVTTLLVVPATLIVPHTHIPYATFLHIVTVAAGLRLLIMRLDRSLARGVLRLTPAMAALGLLIIVTFAFGVVFVLHANAPAGAESRLVGLGQQVAFFVVCLAFLRQIDDIDIALRALAFAAVVGAGIGVVEHITSASWGHWLFAHTGIQTDASSQLLARGTARRVKGGAEFALQYGWLLVMLLPALVVTATRHRGRWLTLPAGVALISLPVYWTYSRSALAGLVIVLAVLGVLARERLVAYAAGSTLAAYFVAYLLHPVLATHFTTEFAQGSVTTRFERFMPLLHDASAHPFRGLGLGELLSTGFSTTDNAFLLQYIELGALGVVVLAALLLVAFGQTLRGLAIPDDRSRAVAAAVVAGVLAYIVSAIFYDAFTLQQGACLLWALVAVGVVAAEQAGVPLRLPSPRPVAVVLVAGVATAIGVACSALAPTHAGQDAYFTTLPGYADAFPYDIYQLGTTAVNTACGLANVESRVAADGAITCSVQSTNVGYGQLHLEASDTKALTTLVARLTSLERHHGDPWFAFYALGPPHTAPRTVWLTAPLWMPVGLAMLLLFLPWRGRRLTPGRFLSQRRQRRIAFAVP